MKRRSWTSYARYAVAALLLYLVFGWAKERLENPKPDCPVGQTATQDSQQTWSCLCNDPALTLVNGVCSTPKGLDPADPKTWPTT